MRSLEIDRVSVTSAFSKSMNFNFSFCILSRNATYFFYLKLNQCLVPVSTYLTGTIVSLSSTYLPYLFAFVVSAAPSIFFFSMKNACVECRRLFEYLLFRFESRIFCSFFSLDLFAFFFLLLLFSIY